MMRINSLYLKNIKYYITRYGLSVKFYEGEITALLGHYGAGKTTTMQMLTGTIKPTDGDAKILGESISTNMGNVKKYVGLCPQHNVLWDQLTV